jgi:hypothetical protein
MPGGGGTGAPSQNERPAAALECFGRGHPSLLCLAQGHFSGSLRAACSGSSWLRWWRRCCSGRNRDCLRRSTAVRWRQARACEPRWSCWRPPGPSYLPRSGTEPRQAQSGNARRKCPQSYGGLDHGGLPRSFRPCGGSLHAADPGNRRSPVDHWKLRQSHHGSPAQAHQRDGHWVPPIFASRSPARVVEEGRAPPPKTLKSGSCRSFWEGALGPPPARANL